MTNGPGGGALAHAVDDARSRGAGPVVIGAEVNDTPKEMYAALGFQPVCITRGWLKNPRRGPQRGFDITGSCRT